MVIFRKQKTKKMKQLVTLLLAVCLCFLLNGQDSLVPSPIIFIYDASGSMWGQMEGKTKMEIASSVLSNTVDSLPQNQQIGLVAYGHRKKGDCKDVEFLVNIGDNNKTQVNESLKNIKPLGKTPLAYSAMQVIDTLRVTKMKATIILVTDGIESCGGNICEVVKNAREEGIDFKLHIIGFGLKDDETKELKCAANAGDGQYYDAADAGGLTDVLFEATTITVDNPAGNFSIIAIKNGEAIDAYVRVYEASTKNDVTSSRTYRDTSVIFLSAGNYDMVIKPLENSDVDAITLSNVKSFQDSIVHRTISFDAGKLNVISLNNGEGWDCAVNIYLKSDGKSAARGRTYGRPDIYDINPGIYDIEIKALAMKGMEITKIIENIEVKGNDTITVEHNFKTGIAMIGANSSSGLVDAGVYIKEINSKKNVANGRTYTSETSNPRKFLLNPGTYEVKVMAFGEHKGKEETFTIIVKKGETIENISNF